MPPCRGEDPGRRISRRDGPPARRARADGVRTQRRGWRRAGSAERTRAGRGGAAGLPDKGSPLGTGLRGRRRPGCGRGPRAVRDPRVSAGVFVVQEHAASAHHFDLASRSRVMRSWAVPKGPSLDPAVKRFAVEVADHAIEHNDFEGALGAGARHRLGSRCLRAGRTCRVAAGARAWPRRLRSPRREAPRGLRPAAHPTRSQAAMAADQAARRARAPRHKRPRRKSPLGSERSHAR